MNMGIRMGSSHFMYNYQTSLNNAYQKQAKIFEQADGSSLHRASDNPMNYAKLLRYNVNDTENEQYQANIKSATSWMSSSDEVLVHMTEMMQTLKEKSVHAANSDNAEDDYAAIYKEMFANMQEMVSTANTQLSDRYLFAGQKDLTKPFTLSEEKYDRGIPKTLDAAQAAFFKGAIGDYNTELFQMLEMTDEDGNTVYLDSDNGNIYTKDFVDKGYKEVITLGCSTIEKAQKSTDTRIETALKSGIADTLQYDNGGDTQYDFKVSDVFTNQGFLKDFDATQTVGGITLTDNGSTTDPKITGFKVTESGKTYTFNTISQNIVTYHGDENLISMVKLNGATDPGSDTVNSTGARMFGRDIFDNDASGNDPSGTAMMNELLCVCEKVNLCDIHWMSSDGVGIADVAHATLVVEETRIGARQQLYNSVQTMLEAQSDNITEDINNVSGTDIAELATKLMQLTTLYNLSLSMGGRILPQSLADYL